MRRFFPYFKYLKAVRGTLIGGILCGILFGAANGLGLPLMIKKVFPVVFAQDATPLSLWQIIGVALWLPFIFSVRGLAGYFNSFLIQKAGVRILEAIRLDYFRKLQMLPLAFFQRHSSGDLIARGLGDTNQLQVTLTSIANELIKQPATLLSALAALIYMAFTEDGVVLVLVTLSIIPLCVFPVRYVGKKMLQKAQALQSEAGSITDRFTENLTAVKEIRAFNLEQMETDRFARSSSVMVRAQMKVAKYAQSLTPAIEIISAIGISITFIYAYRVRMPVESFLTLLTLLFACYDPIKKLGALNNELTRGSASLLRLEEILYAPVSIVDPERPVPVGRLKGDIAFSDVSFSYKGDERVLREVSVTIPAGTVCALVGPSGAGKSTFANLVPRFYDVTHGSISIDGIDLRSMRVAELRRNIAIVSQDPVLFNDTIYNNLLFGRSDATRADVEQAAKNAFAHDFILAQPDGYNTIVGERGGKLSGGQKQRIALARAFLRNAPLLILDEATSALDSESEAYIQRALGNLMLGKTVLIIAHRFSTIRDASMILVFNNGRIIAQGSHEEIYQANPLYKSLYDGQTAAARQVA